jgi:outer membrane protein assembly factor BamB
MKTRLLLLCVLGILSRSGNAENWPHWRGPSFNGITTEKNLPETFSKTNGVKWVADLPGPSAATPAVWGERVFVSSTDEPSKTLRAICLDRKTGKVLWNHEAGVGFSIDRNSNLASPSPLTDGKLVWFYYGTGDLVAFDFDGKKVWSRNIQKDYGQFAFNWTYGASPTLWEGKLFIQVLQRNVPVRGRGTTGGSNDSYLLALDPKTGKELWKHVRPSEAHEESLEAYSTPIPFEHGGRKELLIIGGDCISGHDPKDGKEFWRWGTWNPTRIGHWRLVPSPITGAGVVLACAPKGSPIFAVKAGLKGNLDDSCLAWKTEEREVSSDVATPLFYKGKFYVVNGERRTKTIARVEPKTGKADWIGELGEGAKIESSPTVSDDKIYFQNFKGEVFIVSAADQFKLLNRIPMGDENDDQLRASIPISDGHLFIRTGKKLYCIGK